MAVRTWAQRTAEYRARRNKRKRSRDYTQRKHQKKNLKRNTYYVGLDGEGQGREVHRYVMLAASDESAAKRWVIENQGGLSTKECLDFLLSLPRHCRPFAFAFNYDLTKMLADLPDKALYLLFRPDLRRRKGMFSPWAIQWEGYQLNLQGTRFTVKKGSRVVTVWDVFKFYQTSFVKSLEAWGVGTKDELDRMGGMKLKRGEFDKLSLDEIREYCFDECAKLATLVRKLIEAHEQSGIHLDKFYGAGSTGGALLEILKVEDKIRPPPDSMREAVASAFFGGRFENAIIGAIPGPVWNYDISSAYPYQITFLPCLEHGRWEYTTSEERVCQARHALVRYSILRRDLYTSGWSAFPFREESGAICFPASSGGGWLWREEFFRGVEVFEGIRFRGAWVLESECDCQPFKEVPAYYRERIKWGKEGPGLVLKLGLNSMYGKLAQSIGIGPSMRPPFQCWIWAGMITSGTRAQILEAMKCHRDLDSLLMVATDGVYSREELSLPKPSETGTEETGKPLGGWEKKEVKGGIFAVRPGVYFPLDESERNAVSIRARGVGRGVIAEKWKGIVEAYERGDDTVLVDNVTRFNGAKSSISVRDKGKETENFFRAERYGQWQSRKVEMSFNPMPKRARILEGEKLALRSFPQDQVSCPYDRANISLEAILLKLLRQEREEQPDVMLSNYEDWELEVE